MKCVQRPGVPSLSSMDEVKLGDRASFSTGCSKSCMPYEKVAPSLMTASLLQIVTHLRSLINISPKTFFSHFFSMFSHPHASWDSSLF